MAKAKSKGKSINVDQDPSGEFDFDKPSYASPRMQRDRLEIIAKVCGKGMAAARRTYEATYGVKPTV
jgi:hypothetical protein